MVYLKNIVTLEDLADETGYARNRTEGGGPVKKGGTGTLTGQIGLKRSLNLCFHGFGMQVCRDLHRHPLGRGEVWCSRLD